MPNKPSKQKDVVELAKSVFDEIVEETENEDIWNELREMQKKDGQTLRVTYFPTESNRRDNTKT